MITLPVFIVIFLMHIKKNLGNTYRLFFSLLLVLVSQASSASEYAFTPFAGYRISDSLDDDLTTATVDLDETSGFGFLLSARRDGNSTYDFLFSRQDTVFQSSDSPVNAMGVRLDYYHIGGTVDYHANNLHPFATGGLGLTRITTTDQAFSSESRFSLSLGGGLKFPVADDITVRFDARMYGTTIDSNGSILCTNGRCIAKFSGSFFLQFELGAGLSIAF